MTCSYPGIGGKPIIIVLVGCPISGKAYPVPMMLDTGADATCFPAHLAEDFGHNNFHEDVEVQRDAVRGIGGASDAYLHNLRIGFLHPSKSSNVAPVLAWESKPMKIQFVEKMDCSHGLIGMDIIGRWEKFTIRKNKFGLAIEITF